MKTTLAARLALALTAADVAPTGRVVAGGHEQRVPEAAVVDPMRLPDPVVLVVLDGVRWQEMLGGARGRPTATFIPNIRRLATERGAMVGASARMPIAASGPNFVSLPSYREILSGRALADCSDNDCPRIARPTIVDELRDRGRTAAVFSSWEKIDLAAATRREGITLSAGRGGAPGSPWPGGGDFRRDRITADLALRHLEEARPDFLFLGLGEPDEFAHHGDYDGYLRSIEAADAIVGELLAVLDRMGERGARTHVFVTADHGRAESFKDHGGRFPESARVWLVASGPRIVARGDLDDGHPHRLRDIAPTLRPIAGLPPLPTSHDAGAPIVGLFRAR